ncbi:glycosyltransferase family 39 protein [Streptomyces sp. NPDC087300]|uniref:glycosyltransferase family 39 protein n=1 Tax=Streptomyces sp. NPDC087300 TaxID=3365780 RepID=UPI00382D0980
MQATPLPAPQSSTSRSSAPPVPPLAAPPPHAAPTPALAPFTAALLPALVMLTLGLWGLDRGTVWRDEGATLQVARRSFPEIWHLLHQVDVVHGLYYVLMHAVLPADPGEVVLRLPSVFAAAATAALVAAIGTRLARPRVGLWAGLLYAVTPIVGHYAQEGRSYALVAAGAALSTLLLLRAVERSGGGAARSAWCAYAAAVTGTALLHELAALLLLAHAATLLLARVPRPARRGWAAAACATCVLLLPLLAVSSGQSAQVAWLVAPDGAAADQLVHAFAGPTRLVLIGQLLLAVVALRPPWSRAGRGARGTRGAPTPSLPAVALPLLVLPPAVLFAVSQWWPLYHQRYVLFALAGLPLLVAAGADRVVRGLGAALRRRRADASDPRPWISRGRTVVAAVGALAVGAGLWWQLPLHRHDRAVGHGREDPAGAAAFVAREVRPGEPVLFLPLLARRVTLAYPDGFRGVRDLALAVSPGTSGTLYGVEADPAEVRRRLAAVDRLWVLAEPPALHRTLRDPAPALAAERAAEKAKLTVLRREFTLRATFAVPGVTLRLYVRR